MNKDWRRVVVVLFWGVATASAAAATVAAHSRSSRPSRTHSQTQNTPKPFNLNVSRNLIRNNTCVFFSLSLSPFQKTRKRERFFRTGWTGRVGQVGGLCRQPVGKVSRTEVAIVFFFCSCEQVNSFSFSHLNAPSGERRLVLLKGNKRRTTTAYVYVTWHTDAHT